MPGSGSFSQQVTSKARRPLLAGSNGQEKLEALFRARQRWYEEAELHLATDAQTPETLARQIIAGAIVHGELSLPHLSAETLTLDLGQTSSQDIVEWGGLHRLPERLQAL